jgi:5-(carboxyamino)imidazole ribonucleotide synthase
VEALKQELSKLPPSAGPWILEQFVDFEKELSVLVVRAESGECRTYLPSENLHEEGILRWTRAPADLDPRVARRAVEVSQAVVEAFEGAGVFCVELFLRRGGQLLVNEVAPRPHNSGHYTLDACAVSQFEQQVRVVSGLPLGETRQHRAAVMVNLIGEDLWVVACGEGLVALMQRPNAKLHVYGKRDVRPRRKMGHVTFLADNPEEAWEQAADVLRRLRRARNPSGHKECGCV